MENFESFEEEKKHFNKLPKELQWLHQAKEEKSWGLEEPSIFFASSIMSKIKAKQEKPVFHRGIIALFGLTWGLILGLGIWKSLESISPRKWGIPNLDFFKLSSAFNFECNSSLVMFSYLLLVFWGLIFLNKFLLSNNSKQNIGTSEKSKT